MRHILLAVVLATFAACAPEYTVEIPDGPYRVHASSELSSVEARNVKEACSVLGLQFWSWGDPELPPPDGVTVVTVAPGEVTGVTVDGRVVRFAVGGYVTVEEAVDQLEELL